MRLASVVLISLATAVLGDGCHDSDDDIGKYCAFNPNNGAYLDAASAYCWTFRGAFSIPKGSSSSNVYQLKIGNVPDGYGGQQIFWGNYKIDKGPDYHVVTYDRCMEHMRQIFKNCPTGHGGWVNTDFGTVFGECIRQ